MPEGVSMSPTIWKYGYLPSVIEWRASCMSTNYCCRMWLGL